MPAPTLSRRLSRTPAGVPLFGDCALAPGRAHEFCGRARHVLALALAAGMTGPVLWIRLGWHAEKLNADGMRAYLDPARLLFVDARRPEDLLWSMEEALRAGCVPLVVAELPEPPPLTPVRRLHLAAEAGGALAPLPPLGLLLTPGDGGAQGVESRWQTDPIPGWAANGPARLRVTRLRARMAPPKSWDLSWQGGKLVEAPAPAARAHPHRAGAAGQTRRSPEAATAAQAASAG
ncbi:hypothetical protein [Oceanomicrobium pacificus]|uniref:hypothetical protein n=1 Tax=Oceanomicrobium pacificus TaxID=2692916 RepID=UPI001F42F1BF|nr:hypothetical protein [Oceanomicrobium pacificus]